MSFWFLVVEIILLVLLAYAFGRGNKTLLTPRQGFIEGLWATLAMLIIGAALGLVFWHAPVFKPQQFLAFTRSIPHLFHVKWIATIIDLIVVIIICGAAGSLFTKILQTESLRNWLAGLFFGLAVWVFMQFMILPLIAAVAIKKAFPPYGYALMFACYGLILAWLFENRHRKLV